MHGHVQRLTPTSISPLIRAPGKAGEPKEALAYTGACSGTKSAGRPA